jgi:hypothetical protein
MNCLSCFKRYRSISEYHDHIKINRYDNNLQLKCYFENCGMVFTKRCLFYAYATPSQFCKKKSYDEIFLKKQHGKRLFEILAANGVVQCTMCPEPKLNFTKKVLCECTFFVVTNTMLIYLMATSIHQRLTATFHRMNLSI